MDTNQTSPFRTPGGSGTFGNFTLPPATNIPLRAPVNTPDLNLTKLQSQDRGTLIAPQLLAPPTGSTQVKRYLVQVKREERPNKPIGTTVLQIPVSSTHWIPNAAKSTVGFPDPSSITNSSLSQITMDAFKMLLSNLVLGERFEIGDQLRKLVENPEIASVSVVWIGGVHDERTTLLSTLVTDEDLLFAIDVMNERNMGDYFVTIWKEGVVKTTVPKVETEKLEAIVGESPGTERYVHPGRRGGGEGGLNYQKLPGGHSGRTGYENYGRSPTSGIGMRSLSGGKKLQRGWDRVLGMLTP